MTGEQEDQPAPRRSADVRRLVSLAEAAEYANLSTRTLRRYIAHGRLSGYRVGPRLVKVDMRELDQLARPIPMARSAPQDEREQLRRADPGRDEIMTEIDLEM